MADFARGERLRELREARHLSQEDAAYEIGVSVKSVRSWEHGGGIKWKNAQTAARFYRVDAESLVTRELPADDSLDPDATERLERIEDALERVEARQVEALAAVAEIQHDLRVRLLPRKRDEDERERSGG